ncbi:MAG: tRNA (N(6)-L-threonylcarbamoyladenosine(37)-C(2))-methylthiotransferase MtaB [Chloroflexi bacterium]|nr:tRNA (N(6)-L-threonylcarbamoyladenosine(37)-C(2))-methylthiotransferase MtaB [Chloroflexota bacterium]
MATATRPTISIETHGCKLNQADSQELARRFAQAGYRVVPEADGPDVYVLNTCTVTRMADRKARHALSRARRHNPHALVVATGCYAQRAPQVLAQMPGVDRVLGNTAKNTLAQEVGRALGLPEVTCSTGSMPDDPVDAIPEASGESTPLRTRAFVKIQEGCDQVCAYCIVPKVRGRERSIPPKLLLARAQALREAGCQEIVLTGTQLGSYGFDLPGASLARLLRSVLGTTDIPRLRVSSLQPQELTPELLELWQDPRLCPHLHLPLQSGSATVLKAMRRRYTPQDYARAVERIRRQVPGASVTADVMVGFPGETEELFRESYGFCRAMEFAGLHVFPYSPRPGTSAAHLQPKVPEPLRRQRATLLLALARRQAWEYRRRLLGTVRAVLWESGLLRTNGRTPDRMGLKVWTGYTDSYLRVAMESSEPLANHITRATLERLEGNLVWCRPAQGAR